MFSVILIFGGSYQGKLQYTLGRFSLGEGDVFFCAEDNADMPGEKKVVYEIDRWILALLKNGADVTEEIRRFALQNPDAVVVCNDISCGIVPIDPLMRRWREAVGRALSLLSEEAEEAVRVFYGIATRVR